MRHSRQSKARSVEAVPKTLKLQTIDAVQRAFFEKYEALNSFSSLDGGIMTSLALWSRAIDLLVLYEKLQGIYPRRIHMPRLIRLRSLTIEIIAFRLAKETNAPVDAVKRVLFSLLKANGYDLRLDAVK
jgi:hypothetical protein